MIANPSSKSENESQKPKNKCDQTQSNTYKISQKSVSYFKPKNRHKGQERPNDAETSHDFSVFNDTSR